MKSVIAALGFSAVASAAENHWAVIVAGSKSYSNYRHQADACHAYQVVKGKGIPEDQIILMAYDDIANSGSNPFPGQLFNKPDPNGPGVDVYKGCNIDYKGSDVTPQNFLNVLTGTASGKQLESTSEDNVFVFFSDHGAAGLIAFPSDELHKTELQQALQTMSDKKMFNKLTFYLESCESGSMFQGMNIPGVYGLSASNPSESSWGSYCGSEAKVNGKNINSCLGDLFSVSWMEDSDAKDTTQESLTEQFTVVKQLTDKSEVMQWGDTTFGDDKVHEFEGNGVSADLKSSSPPQPRGLVSARQVDLYRLHSMYTQATTSAERLAIGQELQSELAAQIAVEASYMRFIDNVYGDDAAKKEEIMNTKATPSSYDCEMGVHKVFNGAEQFDANTGFALYFHQLAVNVCNDAIQNSNGFDHVITAASDAVQSTVV